MKTQSYTFDGTGADDWVIPGGNFFEILSTTAGVTVTFLKNGSSIDETADGVLAGFSSEPERTGDGIAFDTVRIHSATAQTIQVAVSRGRGRFNRISGSVSVDEGTAFNDFADVSATAGAATQVLADDTTRKGAIIYNGSTTVTLRVGGSTVTAARGHPIPPGNSFTVPGGGAVYVWNPGGAAVTVSGVTY